MKKAMLCVFVIFAFLSSSCFAREYVYEHGMFKYKDVKKEKVTLKILTNQYVYEHGIFKYKPYVVEYNSPAKSEMVYDRGVFKVKSGTVAHH